MTDELFPEGSVQQLSPRLKWCQKHGVQMDESAKRDTEARWRAFSATHRTEGFGFTPEDACRDFGCTAGIPLWNEST